MEKIFDAHTHTYPEILSYRATQNLGAFYSFRVRERGTVTDLMETSREAGVTGFLILGVATNARHVRHVNEAAAADVAAARECGFCVFGYAAMHQDTADFAAELDYAVSLGLSGVKLHPDIQGVAIDDDRLFPLYEQLSARDLPICLHMGDDRPEYRFSEPKKLARVLDMFPGLTVLASHLGGYRAWDEAAEYLAGRKNVVFDASSALWAMTPEFACRQIHTLGIENVLFGTDYPVVSASDYLTLFEKIALTDDERHAILYGNAARFFKFND